MSSQSQASLTASLSKLESVFREIGFKVRYEKGNFRTGACMIRENQVIVINKFVTLDQKVSSLTEILLEQEVDHTLLDDRLKQFMDSIRQTKLKI